ncbi:MAG: RdgB/HAM1 family non-canonical purine NTP pyrophosphatase [Synergistaceae bacterium]|nr:RdgB/HAM1 family non-canonical purine NTP pyrophosphatase [Synergistaceae bacterium]
MKIVFASRNKNKYREMRDVFAPMGVELLYSLDFDIQPEVDETGNSYEENSLLKARAWSMSLGIPALADDSGLEVLALGGAPGIHSARIVPGTDQDRMNWLLLKMENIKDRRARFVSCIAIVFPDREKPLVYEARCSGTIALKPAGLSGFGYDPIFMPDGYDKTFSELGDHIKTKISHRALAIKGIAEMLVPVLQYYAVRTMENSRSVQEQ